MVGLASNISEVTHHRTHQGEKMALSVVSVATVILSAITNILLITVIVYTKNLKRQTSKWMVVNMSVCLLADSLVSLANVQFIKESTPQWLQTESLCKSLAVLGVLKDIMGPTSVVIVSMERLHLLLCTSRDKSAWGIKIALLVIISFWMEAIILACLFAFVFGRVVGIPHPTQGLSCFLLNYASGVYMAGILKIVMIILAFIALVTIIVLHFKRPIALPKISNAVLPTAIGNSLFLAVCLPLLLYNIALYVRPNLSSSIRPGSDVWLFQFFTWYWIAVPLSWLLAAKEIRVGLKVMFCGQQFNEDHEEEIPLHEGEE